jgi:membrane protein
MPGSSIDPNVSRRNEAATRDQSPAISDQEHSERSRLQSLRERSMGAAAQIRSGPAGTYWSRLTGVDFINSSFAFAALAVVSAFPFLAVVSAATGAGGVRQAIITRMGLNGQASRDVEQLIVSGREVSTLTAFSAILLLLGAIGMAGTLQAWYQKIYDQPAPKGMVRRVAYQAAGVVAFSVYISATVLMLHEARHAGLLIVFVLTFVFSVLFWWCSAYCLLYRRLSWRQMFPAGLATGAFITGLGVFSALFFSDLITEGEESYGPAGVVLGITTYLIGYGVCLHLGAVFGRVWNDRHSDEAAADSASGPEPG